jgi:hypothetical protein
MTYPRTIGHPRNADEAIDMIELVIADQTRERVTRMLLDGVDADAIDAALEWQAAEMVGWRAQTHAQIVAMFAAEWIRA